MSRQPTELDAALDRLYAAPYEQFTQTRDELAKEAKASGDAELAAQIKKERRPPVTVWALNQLARRKPQAVREVLESGLRLREAQERAVRGEGGGPLRDATAEQRHVLREVLEAAVEIVKEAGSAGSSDQHDRMEGTLLACANGPPALGDQLQEGKLEKDLPRPGFGDLSAVEAAPAAAPRQATVTRIDESAEERRAQREAERLRTDAEHRAREAAKAVADAKKRRERAEESARRAAAALEEATIAAQRSREALAASDGDLAKAEDEARAADQALALLR
ncbi:MAG TPA: hypothetical protein VFA20_33880 [Myxococcaceae bacterium]|nr:hypothetical protein [Myxococcaceae bacterium]